MLEKTQREYGTDPDRVYLTGVSSGGTGVWSVAAHHADRFAAIVPISGDPQAESQARLLADAGLPIWNFYVDGDGESVERANRQMHRALLSLGSSPYFTELDGTLSKKWWTHDAWGFAYGSMATYAWLLDQRRSKNSVHSEPFKMISEGTDLSDWIQTGGARWSAEDENLFVCRTDESDQNGALSFENPHKNFELHLDFRCEGQQQCSLVFESERAGERKPAWELCVASRDYGSGGFYESPSGACLQAADPIAQGAFRDGAWNDLRMKFTNARLTVHLNGWKLMELDEQLLQDRTGGFSLLAVREPSAKMSWRNVRIRKVAP
jgi:hypothetical protein